MRNFYFWMLTLFCSTLAFAQLTEDFESASLPGWSFYATEPDDPGFVQNTDTYYSGNASFYHNDDNYAQVSTSYMVSPAYTVQSGDELTIYIRQLNTTYYEYSGILISTSSNDPISSPNDFVEIYEAGSDTGATAWEQVNVALDNYVGETVYFAITYTGDYSHQLFVDDLFVGTPCTAPEASLTPVANCDNYEFSVDVDLSNLGSASSVTISDNQGNAQTVSSTGTYSFGPYASGTEVSFDVADATNEFCKTVESTTYNCPPPNDDCSTATAITSFPYTLTQDATGATQTDFVTCSIQVFNDGVWFSFTGESAQYTVNLTSYGFNAAVGVFSGSCDDLSCVVAADDAGTDEQETLEFIGQAGVTYYIALGNRNGSMDNPEGEFDIEVLSEEIPCGPPSNLAVSIITDLTADVSWDLNPENESYDLVWGPTGFTPTSSTSASNIGDSPYTITGLSPETSYDLYVRGNCNPGYSEWVGPVSFTTLEEGALPAGTDCAHPLTIDALPYQTSDNTANYGDDYDGGQGSNCGSDTQYYLGGDDVVYAYTATSDTSIDIELTPTATYSGIFVYENCSDIGTNCIAGAADFSSNVRLLDNLEVVNGQTYYIVISTWPAPQSTEYDLVITENTCVEATYEITSSGVCENDEFYINIDFTDMGTLSSYTLTDDQGNDSQEITEVGTYTFGPYASETEVVFNFEANDPNCSTTETFSYRCPNVGDNCENPIIVDALPYTTDDSTSNYYDDYDGAPGGACGTTSNYLNGDDVVYAYTPTDDTSVDISLTPIGTYSGIFVYESCADIGENCYAGLASYDEDERVLEDIIVTAGETYYIVISTYASPQTVDYNLTITENTCIPAAYEIEYVDDCDNGQYSVNLNVTSLGSATSVTFADDQSNEQTVTAPGIITFGPYDITTIVELTGTTDDANCTLSETLSYTCPAINNDCVDATELTVGVNFEEYMLLGNNIGATDSGLATPGCSNYSGGDVWFSVTVPDSGILKIETAQSTNEPLNDTGVAVYSGTCDGGLTEFDCDDDDGDGWFSYLELDSLTPGEVIYIRVWDYAGNDEGTFLISAYDDNTCTPATYTTSTSMDCEVAPEYTVTYEFTDLGSATSIVLTDDQGNPAVTVDAAGSFTFGPYAEGELVTITVDMGDVNCNTQDSFAEFCPAENSNCDSAVELTVGNVFEDYAIASSNIGATDSDVPAAGCAGYYGSDVWFSVVVPSSGNLTVETAVASPDSTIDTGLAVYSGACDGDLIEIGCNDDGGDGTFSLLDLVGLTPGETLLIRVWEFGGDTEGTFSISVYDDSTCTMPSYTATTSMDCDAETYTITYDVTDLGSATSLTFTDDQGSDAITIDGADVVEFGPYAEGTSVEISVETGDENCNFSETFAEICPVANDECVDAVDVVVEEGVTAPTLWTEGTIAGASDSGVEAPVCDGYTGVPNDDVWYSFTATTENVTITLDDEFDGVVELFEGVCDDLYSMDCADVGTNPEIEAAGLTVGNVYYVRVFSYSSATQSNPGFSLAIWSNTMGVHDIVGAGNIQLYPNPTSDVLNINGMDIQEVQVYATSGKLMKVTTINDKVNVHNLPSGVYIIRLTDTEGKVTLRKFIKK